MARRGFQRPQLGAGWRPLLMLGYARNRDTLAIPLNIPQLLESWMNTYRDQGEFQPAGLEGSYAVMLFDSRKSYLAVYRSLIGHTSIYFHARPNGVLVGTNLAIWSTLCRRNRKSTK